MLCEAREEQEAVVLLDACAGVEFQAQPAKITFDLVGREQHYPDLLVACDDLKEFWECKRDPEVQDLFVKRRTERLRFLLAPLGFGYRVVSTSNLAVGSYLENAASMRRRAKLPVHPSKMRLLQERLADFIPARASLVLGVISPQQRYDVLCMLLYAGLVTADLRVPISLEMIIRPARSEGMKPWLWQLFETTS